VLTIDPGDTVAFGTLDSGWGHEPYAAGAYRPRRELPHDGGHALTGPVAIRGAQPGMTLQVDIGELVPGAHGACLAGGWESAYNRSLGVVGDGIVHAYTLAKGVGVNQHGHRVRLRPFLGVMGMPPDEPGEHSTTRRGSPAATSTARSSSPAPRCPCRSRSPARSSRRATATPPRATARTPTHWITVGLDEDLDTAAVNALDAMLDLLERERGLSRRDALAYASIHVDLRITQIVNETKGVHACTPAT
jgi:acetamidase/formamidase